MAMRRNRNKNNNNNNKSRLRREHAETRDFRSFPSEAVTENFRGPFRSNVKTFLIQFARNPISSQSRIGATTPPLVTWRMPFTVSAENAEFVAINLDILEEYAATSNAPFCNHCRIIGWSRHPVCAKRYHFIIRNDEKSPEQKGGECDYLLDGSDNSVDEDCTHLLHGLIHSNGYGHLVRLNGTEGGSACLSGTDIMSFWDRLCKLLRVRKISVMDKSEKYGLAYRILHAMTKGLSWYSVWGYDFGIGGFTINADEYREAIDILSSTPLSEFFSRYSLPRTRLQNVITFYCNFSDKKLSTLRDLFCYVLGLIHKAKIQAEADIMDSREPPLNCTKEDVQVLEAASFRVLMAIDDGRWIRYQDLKKALYNYSTVNTGSPKLIDYCLKGLNQKVIDDGSVVAARYNADTNSIEFRRQESASLKFSDKPSEEHLVGDLKFLFDSILNPMTMEQSLGTIEYATRILDCKLFIKDYGSLSPSVESQEELHFWCNLEIFSKKNAAYSSPPSELLVLHDTATVDDLKIAALNAFREVYIIFKTLRIERLVDYENIDKYIQVHLLLGKNGIVTVRGKCSADYGGLGKFRMERGEKNWIVDCLCGAEDDDGEQMIACDSCNVWKHTRCLGVNDFAQAPTSFVCRECDSSQGSSTGNVSDNQPVISLNKRRVMNDVRCNGGANHCATSNKKPKKDVHHVCGGGEVYQTEAMSRDHLCDDWCDTTVLQLIAVETENPMNGSGDEDGTAKITDKRLRLLLE